jgi:hypothetical protein
LGVVFGFLFILNKKMQYIHIAFFICFFKMFSLFSFFLLLKK